MKLLGSAFLCLALWLGASPEVRAEPALSAELHGDLPFGQAELEDALLPRLTDASIDTRSAARGAVVQVSATVAGVLVRVGARERTVALGERTGPAAARVVALVILDLMLSEGPALPMPLSLPPADEATEIAATAAATARETTGAPAPATPAVAPVPAARPKPLAFEPPPPPPVRAARPADAEPAPQLAPPGAASRPAPEPKPVTNQPFHQTLDQTSRSASRPGAAPARAARLVRVSGFAGTMLGPASDDATMVSAGADVRLGLGSWRAGAGLSWLHLPTASYQQTDIGLDGAALRLDAGRAFGDLELTAAAFAMPSRLRTDGTETPRDLHDTLLFGGGVAVRAGARLGRSWLLVASAGVDVFGRRLRVRTPDEVLTSTPLVTISLAVGVSWEVMQ
jgi:hypothetical protein